MAMLGGVAAFNAKAIVEFYEAWRLGYRFVWMPENVAPYSGGRHSLNDSGQVAIDLFEGAFSIEAGRWSLGTGQIEFLGSEDLPYCFPRAINDKDHLVGLWRPMTMDVRNGFFWSQERGMLKIPGAPRDLNDRDQAVGHSWNGQTFRAFIWQSSTGVSDLGSLTRDGDSFAVAVNERGWVVGNSTSPNGERHPVLWKPGGGIIDLGLISGFTAGYAEDINESGEVLVNLGTETSGREIAQPFLWRLWRESTGYEPLPVPPGYDHMEGINLTNRGAVLLVATTETADAPPSRTYFLLSGGKPRKLPDAPMEGVTTYCALNEKGLLTGFVTLPGPVNGASVRRGFVAIPVR